MSNIIETSFGSQSGPIPGFERAIGRKTLMCYWIFLFQILAFAYGPAFPSPFIYDDFANIVYNPDFRSNTPLSDILGSHPTSMQFDKRPTGGVLSWLNFKLTGLNPSSFRALNLLIHCLGAAAAGISVALVARAAGFFAPRLIGSAVGTLWAVHPIHSTAVIYISQRMESLMTLFFLVACICQLMAGLQPLRARTWRMLCMAAAFCCLFSKENGVGLPIVLLALDRIFMRRNWIEIWRKSGFYYGVFAILWVAALVWIAGGARVAEADDIPALGAPWPYFKTQCRVVFNYFGLLIWPHPMVFAPVPRIAETWRDWVPYACSLALMFGSLVWGASKRPWIWIPLLSVLLVLAPTSSFVPVPLEPCFDYRMHLPSVAALALILGGLFGMGRSAMITYPLIALGIFAGIVSLMLAATNGRARDYSRPETIWLDTAMKEPENVKALINLATVLANSRRQEDCRQVLGAIDGLNTSFKQPWIEGESLRLKAALAEFEGDWKQAGDLYAKAGSLLPGRSEYLTGEARALVRQNMLDGVLLLEMKFPPDFVPDTEFRVWKAHALWGMGRSDEAAAEISNTRDVLVPTTQLVDALRSWQELIDSSRKTLGAG